MSRKRRREPTVDESPRRSAREPLDFMFFASPSAIVAELNRRSDQKRGSDDDWLDWPEDTGC